MAPKSDLGGDKAFANPEDYSLSGWRPNDPIRGDSEAHLRGSHFESYAQYGKRENTNQIMDGVLNMLVDDPHDPAQAEPVANKLKELWREGDTVGTLLNRYRRSK